MKRIVLRCLIFLLLPAGLSAQQSGFFTTRGKNIIAPNGKSFLIKGTNLGNWLVPEGYMWQFAGHVQSAKEIDRLVTELIGPDRNRAFWKQWRATYFSSAAAFKVGQEIAAGLGLAALATVLIVAALG